MDIHHIDINLIRAAVTLLSFATFGGIVAWALAGRNRPAFEEAALLPFIGDAAPAEEGER